MKLTKQSVGFLSALIKELTATFPDHIPINSSPTLEDFRRLQGQQEVIQFVKNLKDDEVGDDEDAD